MALSSKLLAEFIGTFMLVFTVGCNVNSGGHAVFAVTSIACVLMVCIYALGGVSGANFNPAVSVTLGISKKLVLSEMLAYIVVQLVAGVLAAFAFGTLTTGSLAAGVGSPAPAAGFGLAQAVAAETLYTFMLCFVVINVACTDATAGNDNYGLAIGFVIVAGGYGAGAISGGCFNPAVALGVAVSGSNYMNFLAYAVAELVGAALASALYMVCRSEGLVAKLCSEFLGTYYLVLTVGLAVMAGSPANVFAIAASLMCMIYALGSVSGAHFNPSVTVAIALSRRGKILMIDALLYVVAQLIGGLAAMATYKCLAGERNLPALAAPEGVKAAMVGEFVFTFLLAFVVLSVATSKSPSKEAYGLAIGSCITAGGYAVGGTISSGCLNPAVSTGVAMGGGADLLGPYVLAQFLASVLAASLYMATRPMEYGTKVLTAMGEGPLEYLKMDA